MALNKQRVFKNADSYIRSNKIEKAISEYEKWLKENPKDWNTVRQVGDLYARIGHNEDAIKKYQQVADHYRRDGFNVRAIATHKMILRLDAQNETAMRNLAELQVEQGLLMEAKSQFQALVELYAKSGHKRSAVEVFKKLAEIDPADLKVRYKYAEFLDKQGKPDEAVGEYIGIADEFINKGLVDEAVKILEKSLSSNLTSGALRSKLAQAHTMQGNYQQAVQVLEEVKPADADNPDLLARLGEAYLGAGNNEQAETAFQRLIEVQPGRPENIVRLAELRIAQSRFDSALEQLTTVVDKHVGDGEGQRAAELLQKVLQRDPYHIRTLLKLAEVQTILKQDSARIAAYDSLCEAYNRAGDYQKAVQVAEQLVELEPENSQHKDRLKFLKGKLKPAEASAPAPSKPGSKAQPAQAQPPRPPARPAPPPAQPKAPTPRSQPAPPAPSAPPAQTTQPAASLRQDHDLPELADIEEVAEIDEAISQTFETDLTLDEESGPEAASLSDLGDVVELTQEDEESIKEKLTEAEVFVRYGLVDKAITQLLDVLETFRFHTESREKLIEIYKDQGMNREAGEQLHQLAQVFEKSGRFEDGKRAREESVALHPALAAQAATADLATTDHEDIELTLAPETESDLDDVGIALETVEESSDPLPSEPPRPVEAPMDVAESFDFQTDAPMEPLFPAEAKATPAAPVESLPDEPFPEPEVPVVPDDEEIDIALGDSESLEAPAVELEISVAEPAAEEIAVELEDFESEEISVEVELEAPGEAEAPVVEEEIHVETEVETPLDSVADVPDESLPAADGLDELGDLDVSFDGMEDVDVDIDVDVDVGGMDIEVDVDVGADLGSVEGMGSESDVSLPPEADGLGDIDELAASIDDEGLTLEEAALGGDDILVEDDDAIGDIEIDLDAGPESEPEELADAVDLAASAPDIEDLPLEHDFGDGIEMTIGDPEEPEPVGSADSANSMISTISDEEAGPANVLEQPLQAHSSRGDDFSVAASSSVEPDELSSEIDALGDMVEEVPASVDSRENLAFEVPSSSDGDEILSQSLPAVEGEDDIRIDIPSSMPAESIPAPPPASPFGDALEEVDEYIALGLYEDAQGTLGDLLKQHPGEASILAKIEELGFSVEQLQKGPEPKEEPRAPELHEVSHLGQAPEETTFGFNAIEDSHHDEIGMDEPGTLLPDLPEPKQTPVMASAPTKPSKPAEPAKAFDAVDDEPLSDLEGLLDSPMEPEPMPLAGFSVRAARPSNGPVGPAAGQEDPFVDLASELTQDIFGTHSVEQETAPEESEGPLTDPGLDNIFREFRKGVERQLGTEDYDTRYNLGIAYKEMGLLDEAIAEFQLAAKDEVRGLECCSMLGLCFMEKGMPEIAIKWFAKGLDSPGRRDEEYHGLRYDLANAHEAAGQPGRALELYMEIYRVNARFRDVKDRVRDLQAARK